MLNDVITEHKITKEIKFNVQRKTLNQFITEAKLVHGNKYDYSASNYINNTTPLEILCKSHGIFNQIPKLHLQGFGCRKCSGSHKPSTQEFIEKAKLVHGNKYNYKNSDYKNQKTKIKIICKIHGEFPQLPDSHLKGGGCWDCYKSNKAINTQTFIEKANKVHNFKYDYSLVEYTKSNIKVNIICHIHGQFSQKANNHLSGQSCAECAKIIGPLKKTKSLEKFISDAKKVHGNKYDYSLVKYDKAKLKVKISCKTHGEFIQVASLHLYGSGCPKCRSNSVSNIGTRWINSLEIPTLIPEYPLPENTRRKVDGYDPITNTIYQFHGRFYHSDPRVYSSEEYHKLFKITHGKNYTDSKIKDFQLLCWGYNLVIMWEDDCINKKPK